ncbi:MAG: hypothetical protein RML72_03285 [Bacteroidia bacterium]|nr:hypothetical protein [Bacteroidia bacterium]MDW8157885.1 hypothetical protein [Bacteroidia bacterium]
MNKGRARLGMFEGNLEEGELEIGQAAALVTQIRSASDVIQQLIQEYQSLLTLIKNELGPF